MSAEHTALPWRTDGQLLMEADGAPIGHIGSDLIDRGSQDEANAEYIVLACNAHDELVAALEGVLAGFDANVFVRNTAGDSDPAWAINLLPHLKALRDATAALALARGES